MIVSVRFMFGDDTKTKGPKSPFSLCFFVVPILSAE
jgi:hypothetical protein